MVWPDMLVTMSPGLVALPPGMFSVAGTTPTTLIFSFSLGDRAHRAEHRGGAAHVELHLVHLGAPA